MSMDVMLQNGSVDCNTCPKRASERAHRPAALFVCLFEPKKNREEEAGRSERAAAVSTDAHEERFHSHVPLHLFVSW